MDTVSNFSVDIATYVFLALIVYFSLDRRNSYKFSDKIVLAEFEDGYNDERSSQRIDVDLDFQKTNKPKTKTRKSKRTKKKTVPKNTQQEKKEKIKAVPRNKNGYTQLQQDCFDALTSLGFKNKKEKVYMVNHTFNKYSPKSVQDFLKLSMSRGN